MRFFRPNTTSLEEQPAVQPSYATHMLDGKRQEIDALVADTRNSRALLIGSCLIIAASEGASRIGSDGDNVRMLAAWAAGALAFAAGLSIINDRFEMNEAADEYLTAKALVSPEQSA